MDVSSYLASIYNYHSVKYQFVMEDEPKPSIATSTIDQCNFNWQSFYFSILGEDLDSAQNNI